MKFLLIPFVFVLVAVAAGCLAPVNVTVNVLSSRMIVSQAGTNSVRQQIDGGASISSNATTVSAIPQ
jgi:hypothetical protein